MKTSTAILLGATMIAATVFVGLQMRDKTALADDDERGKWAFSALGSAPGGYLLDTQRGRLWFCGGGKWCNEIKEIKGR